MSLSIETDVDLARYNTFGFPVVARRFVRACSQAQILEAVELAGRLGQDLLVLGGGSNLVLTRDIEALVLQIATCGVRVLADDGETVLLEAEAGEPWHPFVQHTLVCGYAGLENLSLIPGTVGAAPIQNIGAYGVELKDVAVAVIAFDRLEQRVIELSADDCAFGYRDSRFKREAGRWIVLRVRFRLQRRARLNLDYGPIRQWLAGEGVEHPDAADVSRAVCAIRSEKLPDPAVLGNAGSFFKNPVVSAERADRLRNEHPGLVCFAQGDGRVKLAAGWLIERAGWKGFREGDAGVHRLQALVLVNYGHASGAQVVELARRIQADIRERFDVDLEIEPNVI